MICIYPRGRNRHLFSFQSLDLSCLRLVSRRVLGTLTVGFLALLPLGCASQTQSLKLGSPSDGEVLEAQAEHARKHEVTVTAPVSKLLPDDTEGIPHERFLIRLSNGSTVLVAHDTARAPRVPVQAGDTITIHGEYIWNEKGGVLHWTHHSDTPYHPGGWIELNGRHYE
jgi:hypothetical protein